MNELRIHTYIHSRYRVFDASPHLPFSIVFGLSCWLAADTDPRPLLLEIVGSVLDVPYALAYGLLTLHQQDPQDAKQRIEVDLSRLNKVAAKEAECLSLLSPVNRTEHWRDAFTVYQCHVDVDGALASILEPGRKYIIRLASGNHGVKRWAYSDRKQFVENDGRPSHGSGAVVKSLPCPPRMETTMRLCASSTSSNSALANAQPSSSTATLEVSVINTSSDSVTVQTRGHQRFLLPWGPFQPEPDADDDRMRIIDATPHKPPTSSLQVIDSASGQVVRGNERRGTCSLTEPNADLRPKAADVITLKPGVPVIRKVDIGALVEGLVDGQYKIRMQSKGCRWWHGEIGKEVREGWKVPAHLCQFTTSPLMLESQDEVEIRIRDGKVDPST